VVFVKPVSYHRNHMSGRMMAWKRVGILCDDLERVGILFYGF
jgi:hypothetical protein